MLIFYKQIVNFQTSYQYNIYILFFDYCEKCTLQNEVWLQFEKILNGLSGTKKTVISIVYDSIDVFFYSES